MNNDVSIFQSKDIRDYKLVLEGLVDDFGYNYYHTLLCWCGIISPDKIFDTRYWQVWLVKVDGKNVGLCGLFAHYENSVEELWLGWFGMVPKYRNKGIGEQVLTFMTDTAKGLGTKRLMSYVDVAGAPLNFYYRNGFTRLSSVKEYLDNNPKASEDDFESLEDHVIVKNL